MRNRTDALTLLQVNQLAKIFKVAKSKDENLAVVHKDE